MHASCKSHKCIANCSCSCPTVVTLLYHFVSAMLYLQSYVCKHMQALIGQDKISAPQQKNVAGLTKLATIHKGQESSNVTDHGWQLLSSRGRVGTRATTFEAQTKSSYF
ncbi:TPA: hypothetical protein ACH3X1_007444 [Trebouxia sp. C0004]